VKAGNGGAQLRPVGVIHSILKTRCEMRRQGSRGAPDAWLELKSFATRVLEGLVVGSDIIVITWLHQARSDVLNVHPRSDPRLRLTGVFATRSPDPPNPLGLHRITVREVVWNRLRVGPTEAIHGSRCSRAFQTSSPILIVHPCVREPRPLTLLRAGSQAGCPCEGYQKGTG
jgi:tRNA-Thr(GGU) m(6)t(6)A37 methyltransferase TsaA